MSQANPTVTVIIPTYNRAHLLGRSIRSVLEQTYRDFELLVVDDASTDNTAEVVAGFADERIKYMRRDKNGGAGAARNTGIGAASGEFLAFHDSDDEWLPAKLQKQMDIFHKLPSSVGIVYTDMWRIEDSQKTYLSSPHFMPKHDITHRFSLRHRLFGIGIQSTVIRKACFQTAGVFDEQLPALEDSELLIRMSAHYDLYHISEALVNYYQSPDGIMHNPAKVATAWQLLLDKHHEDIYKDSRTLAWYQVNLAFWLSLTKEPQASWQHLCDAAAVNFWETWKVHNRLARTVPYMRQHLRRRFFYLAKIAAYAKMKSVRQRLARFITRVCPGERT